MPPPPDLSAAELKQLVLPKHAKLPPGSTHRFYAGMRHYFPALSNPGEYMDLLMVQLKRTAHIDVIRFDDWLATQHPEDYPHLSTAELLTKHYGDEAAQFVRSLI